jgi:hypothetical protein
MACTARSRKTTNGDMFHASPVVSLLLTAYRSRLTENDMPVIGKMLIIAGIIIVAVGVLLIFADKIPYLGRLPGDIYIKRDTFSFYFPITTSIIISIILTIIFSLFRK